MRNLKCDWFISFIQVGRNRTHPIFQKLYHTNICTSSLYEFAILHSQTSWIIQVVSYKSFNVRTLKMSKVSQQRRSYNNLHGLLHSRSFNVWGKFPSTLKFATHVLKEMFLMTVCAYFMKLFASKDNCLLLRLFTSQNSPISKG